MIPALVRAIHQILYLLPFTLLLTACAPRQTVPIKTTTTTASTALHNTRDTLIIQDSVIIDNRPDTVRLREVHYRTRLTHTQDTITSYDIIHTEIPVPVEVVREVHRLRWWQQALTYTGAIAILLALYRLARLLRLIH